MHPSCRWIKVGPVLTFNLQRTPRRVLYTLSYYDFAARLIGPGKRVLDVGCGEGLGTALLAAECGMAQGLDIDGEAVQLARSCWGTEAVSFEQVDFLTGGDRGRWQAVVSFDVVEHVLPHNAEIFFNRLVDCLEHDGVAVLGTPNVTSDVYASEVTRAGHVNLYSGEKLEGVMRKHFANVFMFGANDEVVHTGFLPMAHYLIAVGCRKRT